MKPPNGEGREMVEAAHLYTEYLGRSERLLGAAEQLRVVLNEDDTAQELAIDDLVAAAQGSYADNLMRAYSSGTRKTRISKVQSIKFEDAFSTALLDLQSANLLMSAGLVRKELGASVDRSLFVEAIQHLEASHLGIVKELAEHKSGFEAGSVVRSSSLDIAVLAFKTNSEATLEDFVTEAAKVVNSAIENLKKLDPGKILEAIDRLGQSVQIVAVAGRLVRQGIEKLRSAIDALTALLGSEALDKAKDKVLDIWTKATAGQYTHASLTTIFGVPGVTVRIEELLALPGLALDSLDRANNALRPLTEDFRRNMKLLQALITGLGLAAVILAYFHVALPWLPLVMIIGYVGVIAGTVLIGMEYVGTYSILRWVRGVVPIVDGIRTV